jgi:hypothetical protein
MHFKIDHNIISPLTPILKHRLIAHGRLIQKKATPSLHLLINRYLREILLQRIRLHTGSDLLEERLNGVERKHLGKDLGSDRGGRVQKVELVVHEENLKVLSKASELGRVGRESGRVGKVKAVCVWHFR